MRKFSIITKAVLIVLLTFIAANNASAQYIVTEEILHVYTNTSDDAVSYTLDELDKITFSDNGVQLWVHETQWPTEYAYENLRVLSFVEKEVGVIPTAIQPVERISEDRQVFDLQGRKLNSLKRGVNIIRTNDGRTRKVLVK